LISSKGLLLKGSPLRADGCSTQNSRLLYIFFKKFLRFVRVAKYLHLVSFIGLLAFLWLGQLAMFKLESDFILGFVTYAFLSVYGLVLILFAQKDAWCRFQNYKLVKDLFFENRFNLQQKKRIAKIFSVSKCQREAVLVAARDLHWDRELAVFYHGIGYRWYSLIPDKVIDEPKILFTRRYWKRTLFVPFYPSKYFLW